MITRPTVFILGAGASAEYGFPLGEALVQRIKSGTSPSPRGDLRVDLARADFKQSELDEFFRKLRDSDLLSIDAFLEGNQDRFQQIGKAAIAITILRAERDSQTGERWQGTNVPDDHWLRYVWNMMKSGCDSVDRFAQNRVSFVTFNYDRTIEWYFPIVLENALNLGPREARELLARSVPVVHLHGEIAHLEFGYSPGNEGHLAGEQVLQIAAGIRVVHDPTDEPQFKKAWELFKQASLVCILGFGYHPTNIERLRLKDFVPGGAQIPASTFQMGSAERSVAYGRIQHPGLAVSNFVDARG